MKEVINLESEEIDQNSINDPKDSLEKAQSVVISDETKNKGDVSSNEHSDSNNSSKPRRSQKSKGQMTFADFKGIAFIKPKPTDLKENGNKIKIRISHNTPKVITSNVSIKSNTRSKPHIKPKSTSTVPAIESIPKKRGTYSDLESNRYKILKTEHHKKVPSLKTLQNLYWAPNLPLMNNDFRVVDDQINESWNQQFCDKPEPRAKDILKVLSFVNKFSQYFDENIKNISYSDISIGLTLGTSDENTGSRDDEELEHTQNLMNFMFFNFLKLLFSVSDKKSSYNIPNLEKFLNIKQPYGKMVGRLHSNIKEWGSPKEWRYELSKDEIHPEQIDNTLVDPSSNEILFDTNDMIPLHQPFQDEYHPLFMKTRSIVDSEGIYAIDTFKDRVVVLSYLVDLNTRYSSLIHDEVNSMSHCRKDQHYTHLVPNFLKEGFAQTVEDFTDLCESIVIYINAKRTSKYERYKDKLPTLDEIRAALVNVLKTNTDERRAKILSMYDKWVILLDNTVPDNSLSDPYLEDSAKLRLQEFFIARVNEIGDFYIPRMNTYNNPNKYTNFYVDLLSLLKLFKMYANDEIDDNVINKEFENSTKPSFSILYRNTAKMTNDWFKNNGASEENYWFEICNDSHSLKSFKTKIEDILSGNGTGEVSDLLKDIKYQDTKRTLSILNDYLDKIYPVVKKFENLKPTHKSHDTIDMLRDDSAPRRSTRGRSARVDYGFQSEEEFENDIQGESDADFVNGSESVYDDEGQRHIPAADNDEAGTEASDTPTQKISREQRLQSRRERH
ncbi:similar to Saccharomyces cerevisiae YFR013W IOC3 Member of a complex (Isw1a) with Isw1p [Maudiozyma saulgeensis]|uniref:Similar to Saccharomyces cerevisiae YFR013W IOC3 Member of a complex (Isw1a) with Isw1p n=1 Tax=Maudiozyma saulgeensis TaxID=1789683 RepID=A0A1X7R047_9SACH|nr:similar to Saccharomyces cerevisiae YFR013W IOC3 Member of a complex (Isw1a) with Isw1p [Kazachstania saulgeensis]